MLSVGFLVLAAVLWEPLLRMVMSWPAVAIGAGLCAWLLGSFELAELAIAIAVVWLTWKACKGFDRFLEGRKGPLLPPSPQRPRQIWTKPLGLYPDDEARR